MLEKCFPPDEEWLELGKCAGRVLARDLSAPANLPGFTNSAMDGYAMMRSDLDGGLRKFRVSGEIQAGATVKQALKQGEAFRIYTGAPLPTGADVVVIQENTDRAMDVVTVTAYTAGGNSNVRQAGEELAKGGLALPSGHRLNPASVGFLASMGCTEVCVRRLPRIALITTGNELKKPGEKITGGEIYESNSFSLKAALSAFGIGQISEAKVGDDLDKTTELVGRMLRQCEVLVLSGGISAGRYDHVREAIDASGVEEVFHKVNQKPGKPMYFGVKDEKLVFALPGNPASLLVCYYEYMLPALRKLCGMKVHHFTAKGVLKEDVNFAGGRPEFIRARMEDSLLEIPGGQRSSMLKSFSESNCLIYLSGEKQVFKKGSTVEVHPIFLEFA